MELSNFGVNNGGHQDDETVILLGNDTSASFGNNSTAARSRDVTVIVTEGTLPSTTHSTYNNRRHPTAALTPTLTTATPVASHTTVPEMMPLLPTGPADHYLEPIQSHNAGGLPASSLYPSTPVASGSLTFGHVTEQITEQSSEQPKHKERRSRKGSRAPQPPSNSKKSTSGNAGETSDSAQPSSVTPSSGKTGKDKGAAATAVERPAQAHSFHTEAAAEVQKMEKELLTLLSDFNTGKLRAFGHGCSMEEMEQIRDQQENLAKLHFDLAGKQDLSAPLNEEAIRTANDNMDRLMSDLERLSMAIGKLDPAAAKLHQSCNDNTGATTDELPTYRRTSTYAVSSDMAFADTDR